MENNTMNMAMSGEGAMMMAAAAMMVVMAIVGVICYIYMAICLQMIAKKTNTKDPWLAWIPIANIYLMCVIAKKPGWWTVLFFIPLVNIVIMIMVFMAVAEARGKPSWLGVLMIIPIANLIIPGYLAFSK
jgi:hypothetical protein